jgi:hypothetical protein
LLGKPSTLWIDSTIPSREITGGDDVAKFKGFFELQTPMDLLRKLQYDFERLQQHLGGQEYSYAAFDFFVTAEHLVDWLHPNSKPKRRETREASPLLMTCSHIASGAKHFEATHDHHKSVSGLEKQEGTFQRDAFQNDAFQVPGLNVTLDGEAAEQFGPIIECLDLAREVLRLWEIRLSTAATPP